MAYISRLSLLKKTIKENPNSIIFTERSLFTDKNIFAKMLYDEGNINSIEYQVYLKWFNDFIEEVPISGIIYFKSEPSTCYERVIKRNRPGENISLEYLAKCHKYHEDWLINSKNEINKTLIIDCNEDIENNLHLENSWFNQIYDFTFRVQDSYDFLKKITALNKIT